VGIRLFLILGRPHSFDGCGLFIWRVRHRCAGGNGHHSDSPKRNPRTSSTDGSICRRGQDPAALSSQSMLSGERRYLFLQAAPDSERGWARDHGPATPQRDVPQDCEFTVNLTNCDFLGCSSSLPVAVVIKEGEATDISIDIDTGIRTPAVPPSISNSRLADDLRVAGADVEIGAIGRSSNFGVPIRNFMVNDALIHVWEFPSEDEAAAGAATVGPDGFSVGRAFVDWTNSPHFYSSGSLIVLYVGNDVGTLTLLERVVGDQFAGSTTITSGQLDPGGRASLTAHRELSPRLGVARGDLRLVYSRILEFSDGSLGCPEPGFGYTQAIIPGYILLYELNGTRYPFHVSTDGRIYTDCRGENNVAVPFQVAGGFVTVRDAFELDGGGPSHLGPEVVLRTRAEAEAYIAESNGLVAMDVDLVDWETEMLVGTVITGSGCSFDVVTPLVLMRHLGKTVDVYVEAEQTGSCEKAWAQPMWLVVQEVPKDYSTSFILAYAEN